MNLVLIGFRGAGKTTLTKELAKRLKMNFIIMDELIIKKAKLSINEIVTKYGWERFRDLESEVVSEVSKRDNIVIDTGGGVILREENIKNLKKNGFIIWLKVDEEVVIKRIKDSKNRPSLTNKGFIEEIKNVLMEREPIYRRIADYIIDTSYRGIDEIVNEILKTYPTRID
jgi:shikimate kinase